MSESFNPHSSESDDDAGDSKESVFPAISNFRKSAPPRVPIFARQEIAPPPKEVVVHVAIPQEVMASVVVPPTFESMHHPELTAETDEDEDDNEDEIVDNSGIPKKFTVVATSERLAAVVPGTNQEVQTSELVEDGLAIDAETQPDNFIDQSTEAQQDFQVETVAEVAVDDEDQTPSHTVLPTKITPSSNQSQVNSTSQTAAPNSSWPGSRSTGFVVPPAPSPVVPPLPNSPNTAPNNTYNYASTPNQSPNYYGSPNVFSSPNTLRATSEKDKSHTHLGIIGALVLSHLVLRHRGNNAVKQQEKINTVFTEQQQMQSEQIATLQASQESLTRQNEALTQTIATERFTSAQRAAEAPRPQPAERPTATEVEKQLQEAVSLAQPAEQRVQQSEIFQYAVNKRGEVIQDAIDYGQEYQKEVSHESAGTKTFNNDSARAAGGAHSIQGVQSMPVIGSGQVPQGHILPSGHPSASDVEHLLPENHKSKNPVVSNLSNPWFWVMLALIFCAFFAAALI